MYTKRKILDAIGCEHLDLTFNRAKDGGRYYYFIFDGPDHYETHTLNVWRLSDIPFEDWVSIGKEFAHYERLTMEAKLD